MIDRVRLLQILGAHSVQCEIWTGCSRKHTLFVVVRLKNQADLCILEEGLYVDKRSGGPDEKCARFHCEKQSTANHGVDSGNMLLNTLIANCRTSLGLPQDLPLTVTQNMCPSGGTHALLSQISTVQQ